MVIKIEIIIDESKFYYGFEDKDISLKEVGIAMYQLEKAKDYLKGFEFKSELEIKERYEDEEEELL